MLCRHRARSGTADRQRDARRRSGAQARRPRHAHSAPWRRPRRLAQRAAQACALYAHGRGEIDVDDVTAVVSDASALALDDLVDTAFAGRPIDLEAQLAKVRAAGSPVGSIFYAAQRQLAQLHKWRTAIEGGAYFSMNSVQPPLHFRRRTSRRSGAQAMERRAARDRDGRTRRRRPGVAQDAGACRHDRRAGFALARGEGAARRGVTVASVGWVERSETHRWAVRDRDGFRKMLNPSYGAFAARRPYVGFSKLKVCVSSS